MFRSADVQVRELAERTYALKSPTATERDRESVWEKYMLWLVCIRQVSVCINDAWIKADRPEQFGAWWSHLSEDPGHEFFRGERNDVLKQVADTIRIRETEDGWGHEIAYWVFRAGPFEGKPLAPVCQQYTQRVYSEILSRARELLWPAVLAYSR